MTTSIEWWSVGVFVMALLVGVGVFVVCLTLSRLLTRVGKTLDEVDRQIPALATPVATTLTHVGGIADTADSTIARLAGVMTQLEIVAAQATKSAAAIGESVSNFTAGFRKPRAPAGVEATPTIFGAADERR